MSGYGKLPGSSVNGYSPNITAYVDSNGPDYGECRSSRDSGYIPYGHSDTYIHPSQHLPGNYDQETFQLGFTAGTHYEPQVDHRVMQTSYQDTKPPTSLAVSSWNPKEGSQGTHLNIYLKSTEDLALATSLKISLTFASRQCPMILTPLDSRSATFDYALTSKAPSFLLTGWRSREVPVRLELHYPSGASAGTLGIGSFRFTDPEQYLMASPQGTLKKRKLSLSSDSAELSRIAAKKAVSQQLLSRVPNEYVSCLQPTGSPRRLPTSRSYPHSPSSSTFSSYEAAQNDFSRRSSIYSGGSVTSHAHHAPAESLWLSSHPASNRSSGNAGFSSVMSSRNSSLFSSTSSADPPLIRILTLQDDFKITLNENDLSTSKAILRINGNLNSMAEDWTPEEWTEKRRLVRFWRSQNGRIVNAEFEAVAPNDKSPKGTCISCMYWGGTHRRCYVTSVDAIKILEMLVGLRFDVQEKNRVRRNVEGFHPMTMSKDKEETDAFFRVIMGYGHPKPRNIDKKIKVFEWKDLAPMLGKIMSKYVADYFTTGAKPPTVGTYAPTSQSGHLTSDYTNENMETYSNSPRSTCDSTSSSTCTGGSWPPSSTTSPNISQGLSTTTTSTHLSQLKDFKIKQSPSAPTLPMDSLSMHYPNIQYPYRTSLETTSPMPMQTPVPTNTSRVALGSWDFSQYTTGDDKYTVAGAAAPAEDDDGDEEEK